MGHHDRHLDHGGVRLLRRWGRGGGAAAVRADAGARRHRMDGRDLWTCPERAGGGGLRGVRGVARRRVRARGARARGAAGGGRIGGPPRGRRAGARTDSENRARVRHRAPQRPRRDVRQERRLGGRAEGL